MTSSDRLEKLKQQVRDTSNQQMQIKNRRDKAIELKESLEHEHEQNQKEMNQLVRSIFGQSELAAAKERELLQDKLDRFSHKQTVMNEQLIALNDMLADTSSIQAVYDAKRDSLETDYQNLKKAKNEQIMTITAHLESSKEELNQLTQEIKINQSKLQVLEDEIKKATLWRNFKQTWGGKILVFLIVVLVAMLIGLILGWKLMS